MSTDVTGAGMVGVADNPFTHEIDLTEQVVACLRGRGEEVRDDVETAQGTADVVTPAALYLVRCGRRSGPFAEHVRLAHALTLEPGTPLEAGVVGCCFEATEELGRAVEDHGVAVHTLDEFTVAGELSERVVGWLGAVSSLPEFQELVEDWKLHRLTEGKPDSRFPVAETARLTEALDACASRLGMTKAQPPQAGPEEAPAPPPDAAHWRTLAEGTAAMMQSMRPDRAAKREVVRRAFEAMAQAADEGRLPAELSGISETSQVMRLAHVADYPEAELESYTRAKLAEAGIDTPQKYEAARAALLGLLAGGQTAAGGDEAAVEAAPDTVPRPARDGDYWRGLAEEMRPEVAAWLADQKSSTRARGERKQRIMLALLALAEAYAEGELPESLFGLSEKAHVMRLVSDPEAPADSVAGNAPIRRLLADAGIDTPERYARARADLLGLIAETEQPAAPEAGEVTPAPDATEAAVDATSTPPDASEPAAHETEAPLGETLFPVGGEDAAPVLTQQMHPSSITTHPLLQMRAGERDQGYVDQLREAMRRLKQTGAGVRIPPVDVFFDGNVHLLADGNYRHTAALPEEFTLDVIVHEGGLREAIFFAARANAHHGKQRTDDDKRLAVVTLLCDEQCAQMSDTQVGEMALVSQPFVGIVQKWLERLLPLVKLRRDTIGVAEADNSDQFYADLANAELDPDRDRLVPVPFVHIVRGLPAEEFDRLAHNVMARAERRVSRDGKTFAVEKAPAAEEPSLFGQEAHGGEVEVVGRADPEAPPAGIPEAVVAAPAAGAGPLTDFDAAAPREAAGTGEPMTPAEHAASVGEETAVKVTDHRRFADQLPQTQATPPQQKAPAAPSVEELLKGRAASVSFTWIPGVKGKVSVSVNVGQKPPNEAARFTMEAAVLHLPPEVSRVVEAEAAKPAPKPGPSSPRAEGRPPAAGKQKPTSKKGGKASAKKGAPAKKSGSKSTAAKKKAPAKKSGKQS